MVNGVGNQDVDDLLILENGTVLFSRIENWQWSPTGKARGTSMFFGGIRRSTPYYAQGLGGLSSSHSSTAIGRGLLRRRINSPLVL